MVSWPLHWLSLVAVATTALSRPPTAIGVTAFSQPVLSRCVVDTPKVDPIRPVVIGDTEIGSADHFQIIRCTGVANGVVVRGAICGLRIGVDEGGIRIPENVRICLVLHHDEEYVVESSKPALPVAMLVPSSRCGASKHYRYEND